MWASLTLSMTVLHGVSDLPNCAKELQLLFIEAFACVLDRLGQPNIDSMAPFKKVSAESSETSKEFRRSLTLFLRKKVMPKLSEDEKRILSKGLAELGRSVM